MKYYSNIFLVSLAISILMLLQHCYFGSPNTLTEAQPYRIVFVTGDEEYRSEESMPMLARLVERELGVETRVLFSVDSNGYVDPNRTDHIQGLAALDSADLMVLFTRFRNLPAVERKHITDFAESGKPIVGFRTSTHAFFYEEDSIAAASMNNEWPTKVFGQQWITHHGHFADGHGKLTAVTPVEAQMNHPILNGVDTFSTYSWLYHVDGGDWSLSGEDTAPLLHGKTLRSKHEMEGRLDQFPPVQPVAWTKTYAGARVFFTTLGHPFDFKVAAFRKMTINGIAWAMGQENDIPETGFDAEITGDYAPNNSGFGKKYKTGMRPEDF
ncbi:hypothetical protein CEQ90_13445 [Lewinellaceae bacterium SD302]|nr:hypothetical protein CEQ90_13445 [Lewinellaceae bacterium SD302]